MALRNTILFSLRPSSSVLSLLPPATPALPIRYFFLSPSSLSSSSSSSSSYTASIVPLTRRATHYGPPYSTAKRAMSSSSAAEVAAPRKHEWLVIVPDRPGTLAKRMEVRAQHLASVKPLAESGLFKMAGGLLEELPGPDGLKLCGTVVVMVAETRDEVVKQLEQDIYATSGVWDMEKAQIWPYISAFRHP